MAGRKFYALMLWLLMAVILSGGCGGGSSNNSDDSSQNLTPIPSPIVSPDPSPTPTPTPSPITSPDPTPTPTPTPSPSPITSPDSEPTQEADADLLTAEYAAGEIVIGYAEGDSPNYVTQNLTLPAKIGSADISWSSSSAAVSAGGNVTRQADDVDVTLTATASYNGKSAEARTFTVKVIRKRTRDNSKIESRTIDEASSGDISIERNESGDVTNIEGQYVSFDIRNADDALDAVTVLREELGIRSPDKELKTFLATSDNYGAEYSFRQVYKGVKVFGRSLMISTNSKGKGNFLHSSFLASDVLDNADMKINITASQAESRAKSAYSGDVEADTERTERIVYSLEDYADKPVYAYVVRVYGTSGSEYVDDDVFVNAETGGIITQYPNVCHAINKCPASGDNEFGVSVSFDVVYSPSLLHPPYVMLDPDLHVSIHHTVYTNLARSRNNEWNDKHQVSVYSNMREIMRWWKATFDRDSLDGKGMIVDVITHALDDKDNAAWNYSKHRIHTYDMTEDSSYDHLFSAAVDVMAHETTHAVLQYITGGLPNENATGTINEAYADIFACLKDKNWKIGEKLFEEGNEYDCVRNIPDPQSRASINNITFLLPLPIQIRYRTYENIPPNEDNDYNGIHQYSYIISHPAYLMHQENNHANGLTWDELGKVWYESMHMGLDATSKFEDVRRCVVWAAMKIDLSAEKLAVIKTAFDKVGIKEAKIKGTVYGVVRDKSNQNKPLEGVSVTASQKKLRNGRIKSVSAGIATTTAAGGYFMQLEAGKYTLSFDKTNYASESADFSILSSESVSVDKELTLAEVSLSGTIRDASDDSQISGATVSLRKGWGGYASDTMKTTTTDSNGLYYFYLTREGTGLYTVDVSKQGYKSASLEVAVGGKTTGQDLALEPVSIDIPASDDVPVSDDVPASDDISASDDIHVVVSGDIPIDAEHFPDEAFRLYIFTKIDANYDHILSRTEIENTTEINVYSYESAGGVLKFSSLQGIKYFVNLQTLNCNRSNLTDLDLSGCSALRNLYCSNTKLISLDVSGCTALESLTCRENELVFLDVSGCSALQYLYCNNNSLTSLDVSGCSELQELYCNNNQINSLKLKDCTMLRTLWCHNNQITHLDVSNCSALQELSCDNNQLVALDISGCSALKNLYCNNNQLTALNASGLTALQILHCNNNQLVALNVSGCTELSTLLCRNNQLTTLDVSDCRQSISIGCDSGVQVIRPSSSSSSSHTQDSSLPDSPEILAALPAFTPSATGTYTFTARLKRTPPEGSSLILLANSEDIHGSFAFTDSPDVVRVSADFTAGRLYAPVVAAKSDSDSQGGCSAVNLGALLLLAGAILAGAKRLQP